LKSVESKPDLHIESSIKQSVNAFTDETIVDQIDEPRKILVVDDMETDRAIICEVLESENYVTDTAEDGFEALEKIKKDKPSRIVVDYMMPGMDGKTLIKELKADTITRTIPILMLTSVEDVESEVSLIKAGADDYITKPVNLEKVLIRVGNLLRRLA
jgi:DNA-binding response OmpR family regulator